MSFSTLAADTPPAFREAAGLYDIGQYEVAAARYESLRTAGVASAHLYFNLGNAYFKAGKFGRAVLNFERARQLAPRDPDVLGNLRFALNESRGRDATAPPGWEPWLAAVRDYLSAGEWMAIAIVGYWVAALRGLALVWLPAFRRWARTPIVAGLIVAAVGSGGFAAKTVEQSGAPPAIVVAKEVVVRFAPVDDAMRHFTAREGEKLWIVGERESGIVGFGGWLEVERADGNKGWVPANTVERI